MSNELEREEIEKFRRRNIDTAASIFLTDGSKGANPTKLARILAGWSLIVDIMGWQGKPLANLIGFVSQHQASIDTHYHNDYKDVLIAEEIERKRAERKGTSLSITNQ